MTTFTFNRASSFDAGAGSDWLSRILGGTNSYTIVANTPTELRLTATAASGYEGYTVVLTPITTFTAASGRYPVTGGVDEVSLYDASGALVSVATDFPFTMSEFSSVSSNMLMGIWGADITGSTGGDTLKGYRSSDNSIDGGEGDDRIEGGNTEDLLTGGVGADTIMGWDGDDGIIGGEGADSIDAGAGFDIVLLDNGATPLTAFLDQPSGPFTRVDNAELVLLGDAGNTVWGGLKDDFIFGGFGADRIDGGGGADGLAGDLGADTLTGDAGDDIIDGGEGADRIDGGAGFDLADYSLATGAVTVNLAVTMAQQTGLGLDTLLNVEALYGTEFGDTLGGDAAANSLEGADGDDLLNGGDGADTLDGAVGSDRVYGDAGNDMLTDVGGSNVLWGGAGNDLIQGGVDFDDTHGNEGNDTVHGGFGDDWVVGGKDDDVLYGEQGGDVSLGNMGADTVYGGVGNDVVRGGQADDMVHGDDGNDFISGDRGADRLIGGAGADTFHSFAEAGTDWVEDFKTSEGDRVNLLAGSTYTVSQSGGHVIIIVDNNAQMVLADTQLSGLPEGWLFVG